MKRTLYLVLDTETCNTPTVDGKLFTDNACVYNVGWAIIDKQGNRYLTRSFIIDEVFRGMSELMNSAYYADKISQYWEGLWNGSYELVDFFTMYKTLLDDIDTFAPRAVIAHNARFDVNALNQTLRILTERESLRFFPDNCEIWDSMLMAGSTICKQPTYKNWCKTHGLMTKNNQVRKTAEALYGYIICNADFAEEHTALADVLIESAIVCKCIAQHKKMKKVLYSAINA